MEIKASKLVYYKQGLKIIVETDFFDYVNSKVFFQLNKDRLLHLITFFSKNLNPTKCNYKIYDKELLAII